MMSRSRNEVKVMNRGTAIEKFSSLMDGAPIEFVVSAAFEDNPDDYSMRSNKLELERKEKNIKLLQELKLLSKSKNNNIQIMDFYAPCGITILATAREWRWLLENQDSPLNNIPILIEPSQIEIVY